MPIESMNSLQSTALSTVQTLIRQDDLVRAADIVNECSDKVYIPAAAQFMMVRHLISPM